MLKTNNNNNNNENDNNNNYNNNNNNSNNNNGDDDDDNVRSFLEKSMKKWKLLLTSNGWDLCKVDVNRGIFQGYSLIFVICMISLSLLLSKVKASYEWGRGGI